MQILDSLSHTGVRACGVTTKVLDGAYHLTSMGTDAIIVERKIQALRNIGRTADVKRESNIDDDGCEAVFAGIDAE